MVLRLLIFISFVVAASCQFNVTHGPNATLPTYMTNSTVVSTEPKEVFEKRVVNSTAPVSVFCKITLKAGDNPTVKWSKNKKELTVADRGRDDKIISITDERSSDKTSLTSTLTVKEPNADHAAEYMCQFSIGSTTTNATVFIRSPPIIETFSKAKRAIQGDKLKIACKVKGYPLPQSVTWYFGNRSHELVIGEGLDATVDDNGVQNAILRFSNLKFEDRGVYWCHASNSLGEDLAGVLVRAKNRLDALWPFLGIVAEVFILVTLILFYERKRSSAKRPAEVNGVAERVRDDEDPADGAPDTKEGPVAIPSSGLPPVITAPGSSMSPSFPVGFLNSPKTTTPIPMQSQFNPATRMATSYQEERPSPVGYWSDAQLMQKFKSQKNDASLRDQSTLEEKDEDVRQRPVKA